MGSRSFSEAASSRLTLPEAAEIVDKMIGRPLDDRARYVAARHLRDRLAGRPVDPAEYRTTFDAWAFVKAHRPDTPALIEGRQP